MIIRTYEILYLCYFFFNDTATTEIYTLSLHYALPISEKCHSMTTKKRKKDARPMGKREQKRIAVELHALYHDKLLSQIHLQAYAPPSPFREESRSIRDCFMRAANGCNGVGALPKTYINAQFAKFQQYSSHFKRRIFPQPHHLSGLGAQARCVEYLVDQEDRNARKARPSGRAIAKKFFSEERKLKGMMRMMRSPASDVLTERPEEFTPEFLDHKNVWDLVEDLYEKRIG